METSFINEMLQGEARVLQAEVQHDEFVRYVSNGGEAAERDSSIRFKSNKKTTLKPPSNHPHNQLDTNILKVSNAEGEREPKIRFKRNKKPSTQHHLQLNTQIPKGKQWCKAPSGEPKKVSKNLKNPNSP